MSTPSPLIPQGSLQGRSSGKSNVRIAVFTIVAIHVVFIGGMLMIGCKRDTPSTAKEEDIGISSFPPYNPAAADPALPDIPPPPPPTNNLELARSNGLDRAVLPPAGNGGRSAPGPGPAVVPSADIIEYVVVRGDSLWLIARNHGTTVAAIQEANPTVDPARLQPGQILQIPAAAPAASTAGRSAAPVAENGIITYVVQAGDNLTRIARNHGTTIQRIRELNNLSTDRINVGQSLKVPSPASASAGTNNATF